MTEAMTTSPAVSNFWTVFMMAFLLTFFGTILCKTYKSHRATKKHLNDTTASIKEATNGIRESADALRDMVATSNLVKPNYSWTQPQCMIDFLQQNRGRTPFGLANPEVEICVTCGMETKDGIYIRIDPAKAKYPTKVKED